MINRLPSLVLDNIASKLEIKDLVSFSSTCKIANKICKQQKSVFYRDFFTLTSSSSILEMYPEHYLPTLKINNYLTCASSWKNIMFFLLINHNACQQMSILKDYIPKNIMVSVTGMTSLNIGSINPSLKILDCPWTILNCPKEISHDLKYINMSEQSYVPSHIDFSGRSLISINISMCRLNSNKFNFSRTLKIVNMFGCTGVKSLEGFENVERLNMDYCDQIESVEPLKSIIMLSMRHCDKVKDVSCLKNCETLDVSFTEIKDVSALKKLKKIYLTGLEKMTFNILRHDLLVLS